MNASLDREIGRLEGQMANLENDMQILQKDVRDIRDVLVGYRGGWRALTLIVAASASLGALLANLPLSRLFAHL